MSTGCSLCPNGEPITLPDKTISIPGLPFIQTCGELEPLLPFATEAQCGLLQSVGTVCGCPIQDGACRLCPGGSLENPDLEMPFLDFLFDGLVPTCEVFEAYLHTFLATEDICLGGGSFLSGYCGCSTVVYDKSATKCATCPMAGDFVPDPARNVSIPGFPFTTCGQLDRAVDSVLKDGSEQCDLVQSISTLCGCEAPDLPCTLCIDGSSTPVPDKPVHWARNSFLGIVPNCQLYEAYVAGLSAEGEKCELSQRASYHCGCPPPIEDHCLFCPKKYGPFPSEDLMKTDPGFLVLDPELGIEPTCELLAALQYSVKRSEGECWEATSISPECGCHDGKFFAFGANTDARVYVLVGLSRLSSVLSVLGALCIQWDVWSNRKKRKQTYNQLIGAMSVFDLLNAVALVLGRIPIPKEYGHGAYGNNATCKAQGFFIQIALTSIFYNISLVMYYKWTIVDGMRDTQMKKRRRWMHILPLVAGIANSSAGIPFYTTVHLFCHLSPSPMSEKWRETVFLALVPVYGTILFLTAVMAYLNHFVRKQDAKARKWRMSTNALAYKSKNAPPIDDLGPQRRPSNNSGISEFSDDNIDMPEQVAERRGGNESRVSRAVSRVSKKVEKAVRGSHAQSKLVKSVFQQAVSYLAAFYITWPLVGSSYLVASSNVDHSFGQHWYWYWLLVGTLAPLQGFNNALVYFRPRINRKLEQRRKRLNREREDLAAAGVHSWWSSRWYRTRSPRASTSSLGDTTSNSINTTSYEPAVQLAQTKYQCCNSNSSALYGDEAYPRDPLVDPLSGHHDQNTADNAINCSKPMSMQKGEGDRPGEAGQEEAKQEEGAFS